jgi:riboflavin biosynthesis pyrimidine reductase
VLGIPGEQRRVVWSALVFYVAALRIRGRVGLEATTVWLTGELDMVTAQRLRKTVDVQLDGAPVRLVIDVAGLTLLVACQNEQRHAGVPHAPAAGLAAGHLRR